MKKQAKNTKTVGQTADEKSERRKRGGAWRSWLFGGAVGVANSLFGGGGGMLAVPLLRRLSMDEKESHATAIAVVLPATIVSFFSYVYFGFADFSVAVPTAIGVLIGGVVGAKLLSIAPERIVRAVFAVLQVLAGAWLVFGN